MIKLDVFGHRYDDACPSFIDAGATYWWHRPTGRLLTKASVTEYLGSFTPAKTMAQGESGSPPADWLETHNGLPVAAAAAGPTGTGTGTGGQQPAPVYQAPTLNPVTGLPVTGDSGGTQTVTMDLDFHGHDVPAGGKVATITYDVGAGDATVTANLVAGDTPVQATTKIATAINGVAELGAVKATGTAITVTPADTVVLSKLEMSVA
jgi:hypothetical protein